MAQGEYVGPLIPERIRFGWVIALWVLNAFLFTPFIIWSTLRFWSLRRDDFIKNRSPLLVILLVAIMLLDLDILSPLPFVLHYILHTDQEGNTSFVGIIQFWIDSCLFLMTLLLFIRGAKLLFNFERLQHEFDLKWLTIIRSHKKYVPWTTKYSLLGNTRFLVLIAISIYVVLFATSFVIWQSDGNSTAWIIAIFAVLIVVSLASVLTFVAVWRMIKDTSKIHKEMQYIFILAFVLLTVFVLDLLSLASGRNVEFALLYTVVTLTFIPLALIQTQWVLYQRTKFLSHVDARRTKGSIVLSMKVCYELSSDFTKFLGFFVL